MPKVWLINVDELAAQDDPHFDTLFAPTVVGSCVRFLFCMEPGDLLISPVDISEEFQAYVRGVCGLPAGDDMILRLRRRSQPYSLVDSLFADEGLLSRLSRLGREDGWVLEPYVESEGVVALSDETGIPTDRTHQDFILNGTILKLNDKGYFRSLTQKLGIPVVPGYLAQDLKGIKAAVDKVSRENRDRVFLKKTQYCGGMGNLSGTGGELLAKLPSWYSRGEVLVEHAMDFASVAGTLMTLRSDSVRFWGVDEQRFDGQRWAGFDYPHPDLEASSDLCKLSLKIANEVMRHKARGDLNLDWGLLREGRGGLRPMLLECNFRHNGFGQMLRFCRRYFGAKAQRTFIRYFICFRLPDRAMGFWDLAGALSDARIGGEPLLIVKPGRRRGVTIMLPPKNGLAALAIFGESRGYLDRAEALLREALA